MQLTLKDVAKRLKAAKKIIITSHVIPDGDAVGSSLALRRMLVSLGKEVRVFIDDSIRKNLETLPDFDLIERPMLEEKLDADLLVILDTQLDRIGQVRQAAEGIPIINIDHHVTNEGKGVDLYLEENAAATCEVIYELSKVLKVELDREAATCLYTGIATDTGFFNYSNTRPSTLRAAAALLEAGVKPNEISEQIEKKSLTDVMGEIETLQTTKVFFEGKAVGLFIDAELSKRIDSTEGFIDLVRIIDGVDVAFLVHCKAENFCRVSMRSKNVDVSKIAHKLGGGGHVRAAGCSIAAPFEEAKMIVIHAIGEALNAHLQPSNEK